MALRLIVGVYLFCDLSVLVQLGKAYMEGSRASHYKKASVGDSYASDEVAALKVFIGY